MCSGELGSGDVLDDVAALLAERNRIDARLARRVRDAENQQAPERDGLKSMASWLRGHGRLSAAEASRLVRNGRALEHLPALAEAHAAGLVSAEQVAVAAKAVTPERLTAATAAGVDLAVIDAVLTGMAVERAHADLVQVVQHYCDDLDPDGPEPDPTEGRSLTLARHADGSLSIRGHLDAVGGEKLQTALEAHVQADRPAGTTAPAPSASGMRWSRSPTTCSPLGHCRRCAATSRRSQSSSMSRTWSTRPGVPTPGGWGSAPPSPPLAPAGWPATAPSAGWCSAPTAHPSTWAASSD